MATKIKELNSRSRIVEYTNSRGGCLNNINNISAILELQYLIGYNFLFKRRLKWITIYKIRECVPINNFSIEELEEKLLKSYKKLRKYYIYK